MSFLWIAVAVVAVGYVMVRRFAGEPVRLKRLVVLPLGLAAWGVLNLGKVAHGLSTVDVVVLVVEGLVAVLAGMVRGATIQVYVRDGYLWQRYRALTIAVWVALAAVRVGLGFGAAALGAHRAVLSASLLLMLGLSLLGEAAVVVPRGLALGVPFTMDSRPAVPRPAAAGSRRD
jgi:hypothetical protein